MSGNSRPVGVGEIGDGGLQAGEDEREALLEIATSVCYLNAGADLLVVYHPLAARTLKRKIDEMMFCGK